MLGIEEGSKKSKEKRRQYTRQVQKSFPGGRIAVIKRKNSIAFYKTGNCPRLIKSNA